MDLHSTSYNPSWDEELNYRITLEELTYNAFFKFSFSKFREETPGNYNLLKFIKFNDAKEDNNSKIDIVENKLPELQIRKRRESWEGVTTNFIVFEVIEFGLHGLAVFNTTSNNLNRDIRWVAKYIQDIGICNYERITGLKGASCTAEYNHLKDLSDQMHKPLIKEGLICSGRYPSFDNSKEVTINDDMFEIMHRTILGLDSDSDIDWQDGISLIMEGCLKCFTFKKGVRSSEGNARAINLDIIKAIQTGVYSECERFDYNTPTGRWKSEQEMYRCVERVFRGWTVEYQSHPWFLGRQSYDVYVHGKNLAFEYQGKQHFKPIDFFGGEEGYLQRVELDKRKRELNRKNGVHLIYVNYWENINDALIRQKISELGIEL